MHAINLFQNGNYKMPSPDRDILLHSRVVVVAACFSSSSSFSEELKREEIREKHSGIKVNTKHMLRGSYEIATKSQPLLQII